MKRKLLYMLISAFLISSLWNLPAAAEDNDVTIIYTNDIHTYIANNTAEDSENALTYSKVAALKDSIEQAVLVDAGDHLQGTAYGGMDNGQTIISLMNAADYDVATLGNHEFDYGMFGCMAAIDAAEFPYVSANFVHTKDGVVKDAVLDSYTIVESGDKKIAFIGITTPESFSKSSPAYFQDENGAFIYGILGTSDETELYSSVQQAIDKASEEADYVIALGHLGIDPSSVPFTSREVIAHTTGLDAFIDGHSHSVIEAEEVTDLDGNTVLLTQTGSYLNTVGKMSISSDGAISASLLTGEDLADLTPDAEVKALEEEWIAEIDEQLGTVIGVSEVVFDNYDEDGNRLVRRQSTNSGDFSADALYYLFDEMGMDVDVAVMNGGGIRNEAMSGELSYLSCKTMHPFGNVACLQTVTGQQILDALEWGSREITSDPLTESGSLLHVSGLKYILDISEESTVQGDENGIWIGAPTGEYRVKDVQVLNRETGVYERLDLDEEYNLAGYNYTLRDLGGGFAMFEDAVNVLDYVAEDYMVLAEYISSFPVDDATGLPTIGEDSGYSDIYGSGRITICTE